MKIQCILQNHGRLLRFNNWYRRGIWNGRSISDIVFSITYWRSLFVMILSGYIIYLIIWLLSQVWFRFYLAYITQRNACFSNSLYKSGLRMGLFVTWMFVQIGVLNLIQYWDFVIYMMSKEDLKYCIAIKMTIIKTKTITMKHFGNSTTTLPVTWLNT